MIVRFVEEAQREFFNAISYYEEARAGLGRRFKDQVEQSVLWIATHPELIASRLAAITASTFECFLITYHTSSEERLYGCSPWLMVVVSRSIGFPGATK